MLKEDRQDEIDIDIGLTGRFFGVLLYCMPKERTVHPI